MEAHLEILIWISIGFGAVSSLVGVVLLWRAATSDEVWDARHSFYELWNTTMKEIEDLKAVVGTIADDNTKLATELSNVQASLPGLIALAVAAQNGTAVPAELTALTQQLTAVEHGIGNAVTALHASAEAINAVVNPPAPTSPPAADAPAPVADAPAPAAEAPAPVAEAPAPEAPPANETPPETAAA